MLNWLFGKSSAEPRTSNSTIGENSARNRAGVNHSLVRRLIELGAPINSDTKVNLYAAIGSGFFTRTILQRISGKKDDVLTGVFLLIAHNHFCRTLDAAFEVTSGVAFLYAFEDPDISNIMTIAIDVYNNGSRKSSPWITGIGTIIAQWAATGDIEAIDELAEAYDYLVANSHRD